MKKNQSQIVTKDGEEFVVKVSGWTKITFVSDLGIEYGTIILDETLDYSKKGSDSKKKSELRKVIKNLKLRVYLPKHGKTNIDIKTSE